MKKVLRETQTLRALAVVKLHSHCAPIGACTLNQERADRRRYARIGTDQRRYARIGAYRRRYV